MNDRLCNNVAGASAKFMILGAMKAGTTTLFQALSGHEAIYPATAKEPCFFSNDRSFARGSAWYLREFFPAPPANSICMEATPAYLSWSEKTAARIKHAFPESTLQFALIFRDPVQRAYSHYYHALRHGKESLPFADAILAEQKRLSANWKRFSAEGSHVYGYARVSNYASRLRPFLELFERKQFLFLLTEDLAPACFRQTVDRLLGFLGLTASVSIAYQRSNPASLPSSGGAGRLYWNAKATALRHMYRALLPKGIRASIFRRIFRPLTVPAMDKNLEQDLRRRFAPEIVQLQELIGRDLTAWLPQ